MVSVARYALNAVAPTGQLLREAIMHGCPKKPRGFIPGGVSLIHLNQQFRPEQFAVRAFLRILVDALIADLNKIFYLTD
jgi:hypothetical protein